MLKELRISNLVLIESATIVFEEKFNVITGESGAGKSAVKSALSLIAGARAESSLVRKGCEKGHVEALFSIEGNSYLSAILEEGGISEADSGELIIKREICEGGKSRLFINNQLAQLQLLKRIGEQLLHIVSQHASQQFFERDYVREAVELYGGFSDRAGLFSRLWRETAAMEKHLETLINDEGRRLRRIENLKVEIAEIEEGHAVEGEEEELFALYTLFVNSEERADKCNRIDKVLNGDDNVIYRLKREQELLDNLAEVDPSLAEIAKSFKSAIFDLEEVSYTIGRYKGSLEYSPAKMEQVNTRIALINKLKRKFGGTIAEVDLYAQRAAEEVEELENADMKIEDLQVLLEDRRQELDTLAQELTEKRSTAAAELELALTRELKALNMENAQLTIEVARQPRSTNGDDSVDIFLAPNLGEKRLPLRDCASGGELSRLLLALHFLLAGKEGSPTLLFDEVDANIGGKTAAVIGEKLRAIAERQQLICITHFPQVAKQAHNHLCIRKRESSGRTYTEVSALEIDKKENELSRMVGE